MNRSDGVFIVVVGRPLRLWHPLPLPPALSDEATPIEEWVLCMTMGFDPAAVNATRWWIGPQPKGRDEALWDPPDDARTISDALAACRNRASTTGG
jgi:hypothetical protein